MKTVLLIDDDQAMRATIRRMLESLQCRVIEAPSGVTGIELFREHRPRLVITDILMPDKDGLETVREICRIDPEARIIAISGGGNVSGMYFLKVARQFGALTAIEKPFRRDALVSAVKQLLDD